MTVGDVDSFINGILAWTLLMVPLEILIGMPTAERAVFFTAIWDIEASPDRILVTIWLDVTGSMNWESMRLRMKAATDLIPPVNLN